MQPDAVPAEVREWLASTFTRQLATTRKKKDDKPKFRSVAHAIRAGIFVDRIYRRVSSTALMQFPPEVVKVLKVNILKAEIESFLCCLNSRRNSLGITFKFFAFCLIIKRKNYFRFCVCCCSFMWRDQRRKFMLL